MSLYTVLAPPPSGETGPDPVRFVFVKDGFCWPALFIPELWLLFRRMWLVLLFYVGATVALSLIGARVGGPLPWVTLALMHLFLALEGNALRRWKLSGSGHELIGVATGRREEAELRFFSQWQPPAPPPAPSEPPAVIAFTPAAQPAAADDPARPAPGPAQTAEVIGLFPTPGGTS